MRNTGVVTVAFMLVVAAVARSQSDSPTITHQPVTTIKAGEDLVLRADVDGPRPIARVTVSFQVGEGFGDVPFERAEGHTWVAYVPAARLGANFSYIVHVSDQGGRVATWPAAKAGAPAQAVTVTPAPSNDANGQRHLLYVAVPGVRNYLEYGGVGVLVYDVANGHKLVKRIPTLAVPEGSDPENMKGIAISPQTGMLYVTTTKRVFAVDLKTERLAWNREYEGGCDRLAVSPDGTLLYVPSFEGPHWHVVNARTGDVVARIETKSGAHNTIYGPDGKFVYLAGLRSPLLNVADTATHTLVKPVGPFSNVIRPFTVNGSQTLCFVNVNGLLGFEVGDLRSGKMLHHVEVQGYQQGPVKRHGCPSHGIAMLPDESELWLADGANSRIHIFDARSMPPKQIASIPVRDQPGWITIGLDGRYAYPSSGEVIDVKTRKVVATLSDERGRAVQSEKVVDAIFTGNRMTRGGDQFRIGRANASR